MIYLQKTEVFLEHMEYRRAFEELAQTLSGCGIAYEIQKLSPEDAPWPFACFSGADNGKIPETLWITDSPLFAEMLREKRYPILIFLHAGNRDASFGEFRYAFEDPEVLDAVYLDRVYRRFRRLPWDILETPRCLIRETTEEDVDAFYRIYAEPSVSRYMENLYEDPAQERAYAAEYIDKVYSFYEFGIWTVVEKASGEVIGRAGICYREGYEDPEIGFVIAVPWQGRGIATEVCGAILGYAEAELGFRRILAFVQPENKVSLRLCGRLGMRESERVTLQGTNYVILCREPRFI